MSSGTKTTQYSGFLRKYYSNILEYSVPIPIYLYFFFNSYRDCPELWVFALCWVTHFVKRLYENAYVHIHSNRKISVTDVLVNCWYYHLFSLWIGHSVNKGHVCESDKDSWRTACCFMAWALAEYGNYSCHLLLRRIKEQHNGSKAAPYPRPDLPLSYTFNLVSCPHYLFESLSWLSFAFLTDTLSVFVFCAFGFMVMTKWATSRHEDYLKAFPDYPQNRKAIVPYIL